jgi:hypothetical protein
VMDATIEVGQVWRHRPTDRLVTVTFVSPSGVEFEPNDYGSRRLWDEAKFRRECVLVKEEAGDE